MESKWRALLGRFLQKLAYIFFYLQIIQFGFLCVQQIPPENEKLSFRRSLRQYYPANSNILHKSAFGPLKSKLKQVCDLTSAETLKISVSFVSVKSSRTKLNSSPLIQSTEHQGVAPPVRGNNILIAVGCDRIDSVAGRGLICIYGMQIKDVTRAHERGAILNTMH